ncbi:TetR/AcrR family transcriptional regulator [Streptomyces althioticus]|uniref:TetR/AcrR family transcriptional regulator n=1 Tax=Streptomyces TaxID=1883 RepID=UPI0033E6C1F1
MTAASIRARTRAQLTAEIKTVARRHLAEQGPGLSLRAVARDLDMAPSALYRYFDGRDELLTALIIDAYDSVGAAAESAAATSGSYAQRCLGISQSVRHWALAHPHEWALIYGSPIPGYAAPQDTNRAAARGALALGGVVSEAFSAGCVQAAAPLSGTLGDEAQALAEERLPGLPGQVVARVLGAWLQLCGAVSAEIFGQLQGTIDAREDFLEFQMRGAIAWVGLEGG